MVDVNAGKDSMETLASIRVSLSISSIFSATISNKHGKFWIVGIILVLIIVALFALAWHFQKVLS